MKNLTIIISNTHSYLYNDTEKVLVLERFEIIQLKRFWTIETKLHSIHIYIDDTKMFINSRDLFTGYL